MKFHRPIGKLSPERKKFVYWYWLRYFGTIQVFNGFTKVESEDAGQPETDEFFKSYIFTAIFHIFTADSKNLLDWK